MAAGRNNVGTLPYNSKIYLSTNSGSSWIQATLPALTATFWESVASSADGTKLMAGDSSGDFGIYTSTNSGVTWISNSVCPYSFPCTAVAISADGSKMVGCVLVDVPPVRVSIYTSTNSGATWQTNNAPLSFGSPGRNWHSVAVSADFSKLVAVAVNNGLGIWTSQSTPSPQLNITPSGSNLIVSWTIPSTNFAMQQSTDLISWSCVTNAPMLNLASLQNQVTLSPSNSSGFYRLATP